VEHGGAGREHQSTLPTEAPKNCRKRWFAEAF
jgi:hypothetical protein